MTSHEETIRNLKSRQEEIDGIKAKLLEKYLGTFEKAGLKSDDIDFTGVDSGAILAMVKALEDYFSSVEKLTGEPYITFAAYEVSPK